MARMADVSARFIFVRIRDQLDSNLESTETILEPFKWLNSNYKDIIQDLL